MRREWKVSSIRQGLFAALVLLAALTAAGTAQAATATESPVFVVTEVLPDVFIYNAATGTFLAEFDGHFTENDAIAAGDIFGNGLNFVMVAGDETNTVEIFEPLGGRLLYAWNMAYTQDDGLAAGDWDGDGRAEVFIAGDETGVVDVFDPRTGAHLAAFDGAFTLDDGFAVGDRDGDGAVEVFVAGDQTGIVDVFDPRTGTPLISFQANFTPGDGFAVGDVDGDGMAEVLIGGDESNIIDVFDPRTGQPIRSFDGSFTPDDAMGVGDVDGDGRGELVIFGDVTSTIDVFDAVSGALIRSFSGGSDFTDVGLALGASFPDTDGDGLQDAWEQNGIDTNGDGVADLVLSDANPLRKDIYIEVDYMDCAVTGGDCPAGDTHNHVPRPGAIAEVVAAFADAPVVNPDGSTGITMHIEVDDALPHMAYLNKGCYDAVPGEGEFMALKNDPSWFGIDNPRRPIYHYAIFAHQQSAGKTSAGCGDVGGPNFEVAFGEWYTDAPNGDFDADGTPDIHVGTERHQAATLMHELGHNLGLRHGGAEQLNHKPNYLSIMNYSFCLDGLIPVNRIDYSRQVLAPLDEMHLDESLGIGFAGLNTRFFCPDYSMVTGEAGMAIDWNCDGTSDSLDLQANINGSWLDVFQNSRRDEGEPPMFEVNTGAEDWQRLVLGFGNTANYGAGTPDDNPPDPDYPTYLAIRNVPPEARAGEDQTLECAGPDGAMATLDASGTTDANGDPLHYSWTGPFGTLPGKVITVQLPLGVHEITLTVTDGNGPQGTATDVVLVTVQDTVPPELSVQVTPTALWPPDHRMVNIAATVVVRDVCDPNPRVSLAAVTSSEPENALGDGSTFPDIAGVAAGTDDRSFALRAERSGTGLGRIYTARYEATDQSQNVQAVEVTVRVAHP
jgi:hypothetical protein